MTTNKKNNNKATINTTSVKVQFMTSSKEFTATMAKFWVAINEMADKKLILQNNLRISQEWAELKKDDAEAQAMYLADVEKYQTQYDTFKKIMMNVLSHAMNLLQMNFTLPTPHQRKSSKRL